MNMEDKNAIRRTGLNIISAVIWSTIIAPIERVKLILQNQDVSQQITK